jgi:hypothetical protein
MQLDSSAYRRARPASGDLKVPTEEPFVAGGGSEGVGTIGRWRRALSSHTRLASCTARARSGIPWAITEVRPSAPADRPMSGAAARSIEATIRVDRSPGVSGNRNAMGEPLRRTFHGRRP